MTGEQEPSSAEIGMPAGRELLDRFHDVLTEDDINFIEENLDPAGHEVEGFETDTYIRGVLIAYGYDPDELYAGRGITELAREDD